MPEIRSFHLGDILSITTGRLVSPRHMGGVYDLLNPIAELRMMSPGKPIIAVEVDDA